MAAIPSHLILVGYMASGKTTWGKKLATVLQRPFIDTDAWIETAAGKSIEAIFEEDGEPAFRLLEKRCLAALKKMPSCVIATGGGFPCQPHVMDELNQLGLTIYIQRSANELAHRLENAKKIRPLVRDKKGEELRQFIVSMLAEREPFYRQAQITVGREFEKHTDLLRLIEERV